MAAIRVHDVILRTICTTSLEIKRARTVPGAAEGTFYLFLHPSDPLFSQEHRLCLG